MIKQLTIKEKGIKLALRICQQAENKIRKQNYGFISQEVESQAYLALTDKIKSRITVTRNYNGLTIFIS